MAEEPTGQVDIYGRRELGQSLWEINAAIMGWLAQQEQSYAAPSYYAPPPPPGSGGGGDLAEVVVSAPREPAPPAERPRPPVVAPNPRVPTLVVPTGPVEPPVEAFLPPPGGVLPEVVVTAQKPRTAAPARAPTPARTPARVPLGPFGLLIGLIPTYLDFLGDIDAAATQRAGERMGLPPRGRGRDTDRPELPPDPFRYPRARPWDLWGLVFPEFDMRGPQRRPATNPNAPGGAPTPARPGVADDASDLATLVVTGRAPRVQPDPSPWWIGPTPLPGMDPALSPIPVVSPSADPEPAPIARPRPRNDPAPTVAPWPGVSPWPAPNDEPFAVPQPLPLPEPRPITPAPAPRPPVFTAPDFGVIPGIPGLQPEPRVDARLPPQRADPCDCGSKSKSKKKKKPRTVCYRGTYSERSLGLSKRKRDRIDCKTGKPL